MGLWHQVESLQFILVTEFPSDNNGETRHLGLSSACVRSVAIPAEQKAPKTRLTLASLLHTWAARNLIPFVECLTALQHPIGAALPQR